MFNKSKVNKNDSIENNVKIFKLKDVKNYYAKTFAWKIPYKKVKNNQRFVLSKVLSTSLIEVERIF